MSPRTKEQNEEIRQQKELSILETALILFAEDGFTFTSMQSIAKEAGVSKGNLYNYFVSKEELLEGVLKYGFKQFDELFEGEGIELKTEEQFEIALRGNFAMIKENESFWKLYYNMVAQPKVQELFRKIFAPFLEEYLKIFENYYKSKGDENPNVTALLLGSAMDGVSLAYIMMGETYPLEDVISQLIKKFR